MPVSTKEIYRNCYRRYGIAAVNVWCMEQVLGLFSAAQKVNAPFIVQTTPIARTYANPQMLLSMNSAEAKIYPKTGFTIHPDHGNREDAFQSIDSGEYTSVMIDASHESCEQNIAVTKEVVEFLKRTDCDRLAVAVGTSHGAYKFSGEQ